MMQRQDIFEAYERVKPDRAAKERMLLNIRAMAEDESLMKRERKENSMKKQKKEKAGKIYYGAAAAAVLMLVPITAAAGHLLGLWDMGIGKQIVDVPVKTIEGEDIVTPEGTVQLREQEVDMISLQGMAGSPEHKAVAEWEEFLETYDADGRILAEVGNAPTGLEEEYGEYLCYTQEMADKIEEICGKYQLKKLSGFAVADSYEDLCEKTGCGDICGESESTLLTYGSGYYYADGTLLMEGTGVVTGEDACMTDFQLSCDRKGTFNGTALNVGDLDDYKQWEYETKNGAKVLLANSDHKALILAETEKSFVVVNLLGNMQENSFDVSDKALEKLADALDLSKA